MLSKKEVKYIQTLGHKRNRDAERLFIAEGPKLVPEILEGGFEIKHLYALARWADENQHLPHAITIVTESELERISQLQTPNQVLVVAVQQQLLAEPDVAGRLALVLDGIQDPGNMGTIVRIADWFGVHQLICSADCADVYNPKVVQATMGSIARVQCWVKDLPQWLANQQVPVLGAFMNGESVYAAQCPPGALLVIGNEGRGIRQELLPFITRPVTIPRIGQAESLNAAVATGIMLSHLVGQP